MIRRSLAVAALSLALGLGLVESAAAADPEAPLLSRLQVDAVKAALATGGSVLLVWGLWLRARGRSPRE